MQERRRTTQQESAVPSRRARGNATRIEADDGEPAGRQFLDSGETGTAESDDARIRGQA